MVLRVDTIEIRLQRLEQVISELERLGRIAPEELRESTAEMWAVERGLQLGAEILFNVGNHILVAEFGVSAQEYRQIPEHLAGRQVINRELAERLNGLAGFRNLLVHDYMELDPNRVLESLLRAPGDFSQFAYSIRDWLKSRSISNSP